MLEFAGKTHKSIPVWRQLTLLLSVGWISLVLPGCGGTGRQPISGMVTYRGQPLDRGRIEFEPLDGQGSAGGATIQNGAYRIPADRGLLPGRYKVRIHAPTGERRAPTGPPGDSPVSPPPQDKIAPRYNMQSTLTAEVTKAGSNIFDYTVD